MDNVVMMHTSALSEGELQVMIPESKPAGRDAGNEKIGHDDLKHHSRKQRREACKKKDLSNKKHESNAIKYGYMSLITIGGWQSVALSPAVKEPARRDSESLETEVFTLKRTVNEQRTEKKVMIVKIRNLEEELQRMEHRFEQVSRLGSDV